MKTLLKLTVVALSIFAVAQTEASFFYNPPCRSGDSLQNGVCVSGPRSRSLNPINKVPAACPSWGCNGPLPRTLQPINN
jgi:hypothetical protein